MTDTASMSFVGHMAELRRRLLYALAFFLVASSLCYLVADDIYGFLVKPLADVLDGEGRRLIYTGLAEAFVTYIKLACFAGAVISFPLIASQIWLFVAPGLYQGERKVFLSVLIASPLLFVVGALFVYYLVIPAAWTFFVGFEKTSSSGNGLPIQLEAKVSEYLDFVMGLVFAFGICFQLPALLVVLGRIGLVSAEALAAKRRHMIVAIVAVAAVVTPPDVISQLMLAVPLVGLYELSIFLVRKSAKKS